MKRALLTAVAALLVSAAGIAAGTALGAKADPGPPASGEQAKGDEHGKSAQQAKPEAGEPSDDVSTGAGVAKPKLKAHSSKTHSSKASKSKAGKAGTPGPATAVTTTTAQHPAGKITICHHTGSATSPYVEITISRNGLHGHDHHDDIIPAPSGGCPTAAAAAAVAASNSTASTSTTSTSTTSTAATSTTATTSTSETSAQSVSASTESASTSRPVAAAQPAAAAAAGGVKGVAITKHASVRKATRAAGPVARVAAAKLPFTGLRLFPIVLGALLLIAAGLLVRRAAAGR